MLTPWLRTVQCFTCFVSCNPQGNPARYYYPLVQVGKLRLREVQPLVQDHIPRKRSSRISTLKSKFNPKFV